MAMNRPRGTVRWTPAAVPLGLLLTILGAWAFFVPLVGPYFGYGFFTNHVWVFSSTHWELLLLPGIAAFVGGLLMMLPALGVSSLGSLLALVGGVWLVVGPSLHRLWAGGDVRVLVPHTSVMQALLWVGYFYGTGALMLLVTAFGMGMLSRRTVIEDSPVIEETPIERRDRVVTRV